MPWMIDYDSENGTIKSFYHTQKHKNIPETAIEITDTEYVTSSLNQKQWQVDPQSKKLKQAYPS